MSDEILEKARKREGALKAELEEIQTFIKVYARMISDNGDVDHPYAARNVTKYEQKTRLDLMPPPVSSEFEIPERRRRTRSASSKNAVIEAAKRILKNRTEPVKNAELTRMILGEGVNIRSENRERYISTLLSHSDDFKAAPHRAGWLLADNDALLHQTELMRYNPANAFFDAPDINPIHGGNDSA